MSVTQETLHALDVAACTLGFAVIFIVCAILAYDLRRHFRSRRQESKMVELLEAPIAQEVHDED